MTGWSVQDWVNASFDSRRVLVPESTFWMGLSEEEEQAARRLQDPLPFDVQEMRPVHQVRVEAFLSMKTPVTWSVVRKLIEVGDIDQRPVFSDQIESSPAYLRRHEVDELAARLGVQLPTEAQWECMFGVGILHVGHANAIK